MNYNILNNNYVETTQQPEWERTSFYRKGVDILVYSDYDINDLEGSSWDQKINLMLSRNHYERRAIYPLMTHHRFESETQRRWWQYGKFMWIIGMPQIWNFKEVLSEVKGGSLESICCSVWGWDITIFIQIRFVYHFLNNNYEKYKSTMQERK